MTAPPAHIPRATIDYEALRTWAEYLDQPTLDEALLRQLISDLLAAADEIERLGMAA